MWYSTAGGGGESSAQQDRACLCRPFPACLQHCDHCRDDARPLGGGPAAQEITHLAQTEKEGRLIRIGLVVVRSLAQQKLTKFVSIPPPLEQATVYHSFH